MPQHDSYLLVRTLQLTGLAHRARALDLCTGSGVVAVAAAEFGADSVMAYDICPRAVRCARTNARTAGVEVSVRQGSWRGALDCAPFDLVTANPPYVPSPGIGHPIPAAGGPERSWNGGVNGRVVLDPLCQSATSLLRRGGTMLLVQSALADPLRSVGILRESGLAVQIAAVRSIPFGPVLWACSGWLEETGRIGRGCRTEQILVIRADKL
ncbi:methyltransferase [Mycolicibacter minnesotensis]